MSQLVFTRLISITGFATRLSKTGSAQCRNSLLLLAQQKQQPYVNVPLLSRKLHSLQESQSKLVAAEVSHLRHPLFEGSALQRFGFSSSASQQPSGNEQGTAAKNCFNADSKSETTQSGKEFKSDLVSFLDVEDLSRDQLMKIVKNLDEHMKVKDKEFVAWMEKNMDNRNIAGILQCLDCRMARMEDKVSWEIAGPGVRFVKRILWISLSLCLSTNVIVTWVLN